MTTIAGVAERGRVLIGADSAGVTDWSLTIRMDAKVFRSGPYLVGFTYSYRMGQLLRYVFKPPVPPKCPGRLMRFMAVEFVDALRVSFKAAGWSRMRDGQEEGGTFLVGVRGRLFRIEGDYQVGESRSGYDAVGCGGDVARGALFAARTTKPRARVLLALRAAEQHSCGVRGPFVILEAHR